MQTLNKNRKSTILSIAIMAIVFLFFLFLTNTSNAAISRTFNYQGKLTDTSDVAVADGAYDIVFSIYSVGGGTAPAALWTETWTSAELWSESSTTTISDGDGGDCPIGSKKIAYATTTNENTLAAGQYLWNTTQKEYAILYSVVTGSNYVCVWNPPSTWNTSDDLTNRVYVRNGIFSVALGSVNPIDIDITGDYYLGVKVGTDAEMVPRKRITPAPVALNTQNVVSDGYIDIGTTASAHDAVNINSSGDYDALEVSQSSGAGTALKVIQSGTGRIMSLFDNTDEIFSVLDGGNVGIGITATSYKLDVSGTLRVGSTAYFASNVGIGTAAPKSLLQVDSAVSDPLKLRIHTESASTDYLAGLAFGVDTSNQYMKSAIAHQRKSSNGMGDLLFLVDSNSDGADVGINDEKMRITSSGRTGIGTTNPTAMLSVAGGIRSGSTYASIGSTSASNNSWFEGSVGIGTTNPGYKLEVAGNLGVSGTAVFSYVPDGGSEVSAVLINGSNQLVQRELGSLAFSSSTYDNYQYWTAQDGDTTTYNIDSTETLQFAEGTGIDVNFTGSNVLTFTHADTSSASSSNNSNLTFIQDITLDTLGHLTALGTGTVGATNGLSTSSANIILGGTLTQATTITQSSYDMIFNLSGNGDFRIQDGGTDVFFVKEDGNVGIGTTNPLGVFHVGIGATNALFVSSGGSVGIGTTSIDSNNSGPYKLDIRDGGMQIAQSGFWTESTMSTFGDVFWFWEIYPLFSFVRGLGTKENPLPVTANKLLGGLYFRGQYGTAPSNIPSYDQSPYITGYAGDNFSSSQMGAGLKFATVGTGITTSSVKMIIEPGGDVGIGTTNPSYKLDVANDAASSFAANFFNDGNNVNRYGIRVQAGADNCSTTGTCYVLTNYDGDGTANGGLRTVNGTFGVYSGSDRRLKTDIQDTNIIGLDIVNGLRVADYRRKTDGEAGPMQTGFIAQEAQAIFPDMVAISPDGYLSITNDVLIPVLAKAIQEQQGIINVQEIINSDQELKLTSLDLKTNQNITSVSDLQKSVDEQLGIISDRLTEGSVAFDEFNDELISIKARLDDGSTAFADHSQRITNLEDLSLVIQSQIDEIKALNGIEVGLSQIEKNTNDIDYLKTLLGLDTTIENGNISLVGKIEAAGIVAGTFTVRVADEEESTVGEGEITPVEKDDDEDGVDDETDSDGKSVKIETKAVGDKSKIFTSIESDKPTKYPLTITEKKAGEFFKVEVPDSVTETLKFSWWIIEEADETGE